MEIVSLVCAVQRHWTGLTDLGGAFGGAVESRASEEKVDLLPGFTTGLFYVQETLDLWAGARP